jgi:hypothetical protein
MGITQPRSPQIPWLASAVENGQRKVEIRDVEGQASDLTRYRPLSNRHAVAAAGRWLV